MSVNQTHLLLHYKYYTKYSEVLPQTKLTRVPKLEEVEHDAEKVRELKTLLKKCLVIGCDTGRRSTFTLTYNFLMQAGGRAAAQVRPQARNTVRPRLQVRHARATSA